MKYTLTKKNSLIKHKALPATARMRTEEFKQEMRSFVEMCEKYLPERDLVDLIDMNYIITPEEQDWVNAEIFPRFMNIIKRLALVMPAGIFESTALEQTMEEETDKEFYQKYFDEENQALEWLMRPN